VSRAVLVRLGNVIGSQELNVASLGQFILTPFVLMVDGSRLLRLSGEVGSAGGEPGFSKLLTILVAAWVETGNFLRAVEFTVRRPVA